MGRMIDRVPGAVRAALVSLLAAGVLSGCLPGDLLQTVKSMVNKTLNLTVINSGGGNTVPAGTVAVSPSAATPISATATAGYQFVNWEVTSGTGASFNNDTAGSTSVTLTTGDATVRANFSIWKVGTPQFDVSGGTIASPTVYTSTQTIHLSTTPADALIYYTTATGGASPPDPTTGSTLYSSGAPIVLSAQDTITTIKAIAFKAGMTESLVASSTYKITGTVANPTITPTPSAASPADSFSVSITCATSGSSIRYTTDGTTPTSTVGIAYVSAFTVDKTCTVKAIAYKTDWSNSAVVPANIVCAWARNFGTASQETGYAILPIPGGGGYYVAGQVGGTGYTRRLMKITEAGSAVTWAKSYNEPGAGIGSCMTTTQDGGLVTVGTYYSAPSDVLAVVTKLDSSGAVSWMMKHQPSSMEAAQTLTFRAVKELPDGKFIVCGDTVEDMAPYQGIVLAKLYSSGAKEWGNTYVRSPIDASVGMKGYSVDVIKSGAAVTGYVLAGAINQDAGTKFNALVVKTDTAGAIVNSWVYGGNSLDDDDVAYMVRCTSDGGFIVVGKSKSVTTAASDYNAMILKINASGAIQWQSNYGYTGNDVLYAVEETEAGVYVAVGETSSFGAGGTDAWVLKLDSTGSTIWQKTYGSSGNEAAYALCVAADGSYAITGSTSTWGTAGDEWVLKLAKDGKPQYNSGSMKLGLDSTAAIPSMTLKLLTFSVGSSGLGYFSNTAVSSPTSANVTLTTGRQYP
jgi:hypothetical protein